MRFKTESGAEYTFDGTHLTRHGNFSPGIDYESVPDGERHEVADMSEITIGESARFVFTNGTFRLTTPVTEITA